MRTPTQPALNHMKSFALTILCAPAIAAMAAPAPSNPGTQAAIKGLWALTEQAIPVSVDDVGRSLNLNLSHYVDEPDQRSGWAHVLTPSGGASNESAGRQSVKAIELGNVAPRGISPANQEIRITFNESVCISTKTVATFLGEEAQTYYAAIHRRVRVVVASLEPIT